MCDSGHDSSGPLVFLDSSFRSGKRIKSFRVRLTAKETYAVVHFLLERKTEEAAESYVKKLKIFLRTHTKLNEQLLYLSDVVQAVWSDAEPNDVVKNSESSNSHLWEQQRVKVSRRRERERAIQKRLE